jgi:hypothetical protein
MVGFIVKNAAYGVGRVETAQHGRVCVRFFSSNRSLEFAVQKFPIDYDNYEVRASAGSCFGSAFDWLRNGS